MSFNEGFFAASNDVRLYWRSMIPPEPHSVRGHVAIVTGYCEHSGRYRELMEKLANQGFAAHCFDHRGHGQSDGRRTHVSAFSDYVADVELFVSHVRGQADGKRVFILGHSLGGLIALSASIANKNIASGLILSAPMLALAFKPNPIALMLAKAADRVTPWLPIPNPLKVSQLTSDDEIRRATSNDPLYLRTVTPRWIIETERARADVLRGGAEVQVPCLMLLGGADPIADTAESRDFFQRIRSSDKSLKIYDGMLHEVLNEVDRSMVQSDLVEWLRARAVVESRSGIRASIPV